MKLKKFVINQILFYIILLIFCTSLLSTGLQNLSFKDGSPIPGSVTNPNFLQGRNESTISSIYGKTINSTHLQSIISILFFATIILIFYSIVKNLSKKVIRNLIAVLILLFIIFSIANQFQVENQNSTPLIVENESQISNSDINLKPVNEPPTGLFWIVIGIFAILFMSMIVLVLRNPNKKNSFTDPLALQIESALSLLEEGQNFQNTIINCYSQMVEVIKEEFEIEREKSITPNEFKDLLIKRGLPSEPVNDLTYLFEKIRYGSKLISPTDENLALQNLLEIQLSCQTRK